MWSAGLRYLFMLPMSWILASRFGGAVKVLNEVKRHPFSWFLWSTVGFGLFYAPLTWASVYGESWFVAATWQLTIVAGILHDALQYALLAGDQFPCTVFTRPPFLRTDCPGFYRRSFFRHHSNPALL